MTRRISIIVGIAVTALAVAVPTALGDGRLAGSIESQPADFWNYDSTGAKVANTSPGVAPQDLGDLFGTMSPTTVSRPDSHDLGQSAQGYRDAHERANVPQYSAPTYRDGFEHAPAVTTSDQPFTYRDAFERSAPPSGSIEATTVTSGTELEWPQIGLGFAFGLLLALGLLLTVRSARIRPLAH